MIKLTKLAKKAYIDLQPGLYLTTKRSSCGKTYLCEILKAYRKAGYPVNTYTYDDLDRVDMSKELDINKYKLIVIDRYDMYRDMCHNEILKFVDAGGIVIIDCKEYFALRPKCKLCVVDITQPGVIEVM